LIKLVEDENILVRQSSVEGLGLIAENPELVVPVLTNLLDSDEYTMRLKAFEALGHFHGNAAGAVPRLIEFLTVDDVLIQKAVLFALARIGPAAVTVVIGSRY